MEEQAAGADRGGLKHGTGGGGGVNAGVTMLKEETCDELRREFKSMPSDKFMRKHRERLDLAVGGALAAVFGVLVLLVYGRERWCATRCARLSTRTLLLAFVIVVALPALVLRSRLRDAPLKDLTVAAKNCEEPCCKVCNGLCTDARKAIESGESIAARIFAVAPFILVLFIGAGGLRAIFATRASSRGVARSRSSTPNGHNAIAVLAVTVPPRPVFHSHTRTFVLRNVRRDDNTSDEAPCAICLIEMWEEGKHVAQLPCSHRFHSSCVLDWLRKAPQPSCPLCKAVVSEASPSLLHARPSSHSLHTIVDSTFNHLPASPVLSTRLQFDEAVSRETTAERVQQEREQ